MSGKSKSMIWLLPTAAFIKFNLGVYLGYFALPYLHYCPYLR